MKSKIRQMGQFMSLAQAHQQHFPLFSLATLFR
jgi:hypothetical protein